MTAQGQGGRRGFESRLPAQCSPGHWDLPAVLCELCSVTPAAVTQPTAPKPDRASEPREKLFKTQSPGRLARSVESKSFLRGNEHECASAVRVCMWGGGQGKLHAFLTSLPGDLCCLFTACLALSSLTSDC